MTKLTSSLVSPLCGLMGSVAVLLLLLANYASSGDPCPPKAELAPCTCSHVSLGKMAARMAGIEAPVTTPMAIESSGENSRLSTLRTSLIKPGSVRAVDTTGFPLPPENSSFYTVVTCNVPKTQHVLEDVVTNALHRKWIDKLVVSTLPPAKEHTLVRLPREWLKNVRVKQFEVRDTVLSGDFISYNSPFQGQEQSLVWFTARNCYLSGGLSYDTVGTVFTKGLNSLPRIEGIDLSKNHLVFIFALAFKYPPANLTTINLSYNSIQVYFVEMKDKLFFEIKVFPRTSCTKWSCVASLNWFWVAFHLKVITEILHTLLDMKNAAPGDIYLSALEIGIEGGTFASVNLKHLDLSHNLLEGVARSYFASPARFLEHINLSWNQIKILPTDFFVNMPRLRVVNLRNNFLYSMPDKPWDSVWRQLSFVDVTGNFIECDCSLMWLLPILSPPDVNSTTTPAPMPLPGQTVLGSCSQTQPQLFSKMRVLVNLTRSDLNCS